MANIFSGYKHVETFGHADEYEDEVEEVYVTLDLGNVEPTLVPSSSTFRVAVGSMIERMPDVRQILTKEWCRV